MEIRKKMIHSCVLIVDTNTGLAPFFGGPLWDIGWGDTSFDINAFKAHSKQWAGIFRAVKLFNMGLYMFNSCRNFHYFIIPELF